MIVNFKIILIVIVVWMENPIHTNTFDIIDHVDFFVGLMKVYDV